jgi:hypothetical protein
MQLTAELANRAQPLPKRAPGALLEIEGRLASQ